MGPGGMGPGGMGPGVGLGIQQPNTHFQHMDLNPNPAPNFHQGEPMGGLRPNGHNQKAFPNFDTNIPVNTKPTYEGFTFSKQDAGDGERQTWARAHKTSMPVTNAVLLTQVRKQQQKGVSVLKQYSGLEGLKRAQIDRLIEDKNKADRDPRFEWKLASVTTEERNIGRLSKETTSMQVILKRILKPTVVQSSTVNNGKLKGLGGTVVDLDAKKDSRDKHIQGHGFGGVAYPLGQNAFMAPHGPQPHLGHNPQPPHPQGGFPGMRPAPQIHQGPPMHGPPMQGPHGNGPTIEIIHDHPPPPPHAGPPPNFRPPGVPFAPTPPFPNPFMGAFHDGPPKSPKKSKNPKIHATAKDNKRVGEWLDVDSGSTSESDSDFTSVFDNDDNDTIMTPSSSRSSDGRGKEKKHRRESHESHHAHGKDHHRHESRPSRESGRDKRQLSPVRRQHRRRSPAPPSPSYPTRERQTSSYNDEQYEIRPARGPGLRRLSTTPAEYPHERPLHRRNISYNDYEHEQDYRPLRGALPSLPIRRGSIIYGGQRRLAESPYSPRDSTRDRYNDRERERETNFNLDRKLEELKLLDKEKEEKLDRLDRLSRVESEKLDRIDREKERLERIERERYARETLERERFDRDRLDRDRLDRDRLDRDRLDRDRLDRERLDRDRYERRFPY